MLFYLVISIFVAVILSLVRTKNAHFIFGSVILTAGALLLLYSYLSPPPKLEDYSVSRIRYERCYFDRDAQDIILESEGGTYAVTRRLIEKSTNLDNALDGLCTETEAKVWLPNTRGQVKVARGIETAKILIPVENGLEMDRPSDFIGLGWLFVFLGVLVCALTLILGDSIYGHITF